MTDDRNQTPTAEKVSIDEKRAEYERFEFAVCQNGYVNVCNRSHNDDTAHTYSVETRDGRAEGCSCPHNQYRGVRCKHMRAVENNPIVASSARAAGSNAQVATDGGKSERKEPVRSERPDFRRGHSDGPELL